MQCINCIKCELSVLFDKVCNRFVSSMRIWRFPYSFYIFKKIFFLYFFRYGKLTRETDFGSACLLNTLTAAF